MDLIRMLSYPCYTIFPTRNMVFVRSGVSENEICWLQNFRSLYK